MLFAAAAGVLVLAGSLGLVIVLLHPPRRTLGFALARRLPGSPTELGLAYTESEFVLQDGVRTTAWMIEGSKAAGDVLFVSHGWGESRFVVLPRLVGLAPYFSRIIVYDMRGHGDSTARITRMGSREVDDLLCLVEQIGDKMDIQNPTASRIVLMGYSMGGGVSIAAAANASAQIADQIAGVIADGPPRNGLEPLVGVIRQTRWPPYPMAWLANLAVGVLFNFATDQDRIKRAAKTKCPLLVLHGKNDPICPFESGRLIAGAAPRGELVVFDEGGHLDLMEVDPKRYAEAVAQFVEAISRAQLNEPTSGQAKDFGLPAPVTTQLSAKTGSIAGNAEVRL